MVSTQVSVRDGLDEDEEEKIERRNLQGPASGYPEGMTAATAASGIGDVAIMEGHGQRDGGQGQATWSTRNLMSTKSMCQPVQRGSCPIPPPSRSQSHRCLRPAER